MSGAAEKEYSTYEEISDAACTSSPLPCSEPIYAKPRKIRPELTRVQQKLDCLQNQLVAARQENAQLARLIYSSQTSLDSDFLTGSHETLVSDGLKPSIKSPRRHHRMLSPTLRSVMTSKLKSQSASEPTLSFGRKETAELFGDVDSLHQVVRQLCRALTWYQEKYGPYEENNVTGTEDVPNPLLDAVAQLLARPEVVMSLIGISKNEKLNWEQVVQHVDIVLEENRDLVKAIEKQRNEFQEIHSQHLMEVSDLSKKLLQLEAEKHSLSSELEDFRLRCRILEQRQHQIETEGKELISKREHSAALQECHRLLAELKENYSKDTEKALQSLKALQEKKTSQQLKLSHLQTLKQQLVAENKVLLKAYNASRAKMVKVQHALAKTQEQIESSRRLSRQLQKRVELLTTERNELALKAREYHEELLQLMDRLAEDNAVTKMINIKKNKVIAVRKLEEATERLNTQSKALYRQHSAYQSEIERLKKIDVT